MNILLNSIIIIIGSLYQLHLKFMNGYLLTMSSYLYLKIVSLGQYIPMVYLMTRLVKNWTREMIYIPWYQAYVSLKEDTHLVDKCLVSNCQVRTMQFSGHIEFQVLVSFTIYFRFSHPFFFSSKQRTINKLSVIVCLVLDLTF